MVKNMFFYDTPVGKIAVCEKDGKITDLCFDKRTPHEAGYIVRETEVLREAGCQLEEYFLGRRKVFNLPLMLEGTEFRNAVWEALLTIPYGETRSYKEIAQMIGNPNACRAVGQANNKNPISIIVPCHRVIGSDGNLLGYGAGLEIKEYLLDFERRHK